MARKPFMAGQQGAPVSTKQIKFVLDGLLTFCLVRWESGRNPLQTVINYLGFVSTFR